MKKKRLDDILISRALATTKQEAGILVLEGRVFINGQRAISSAQMVDGETPVSIAHPPAYVGRGGEKLAHALRTFGLHVRNAVCMDVGSATGGFTDVLLQNGARRVYAVDTANGKLDIKLREDPRVTVMEKTNIVRLSSLPEPVDIVTVDVSLTSLRNVLPHLKKFLQPDGEVVTLFKPQYEVADKKFLKHGILEDDAVRLQTLNDFLAWLSKNGWKLLGQATSPIKGSEGNVEYLLHLKYQHSKINM